MSETIKQIDACILNANKVHFVGYSLGGLVIRAYMQNNQYRMENIGKVVLLGAPNKGSELADYYKDSWLMDAAGGISQALVTGSRSLGNQIDELEINVDVIAGRKSFRLTNAQFNRPNDGLVSAESTKLKVMSDFIEIEVSHSQMRYSAEVAEQTIYFLKNGIFNH